MSDFETLPDTFHRVKAPVVQTHYAGETVPCPTYLVRPGSFDVFFPTDFHTFAELYMRANGRLVRCRRARFDRLLFAFLGSFFFFARIDRNDVRPQRRLGARQGEGVRWKSSITPTFWKSWLSYMTRTQYATHPMVE